MRTSTSENMDPMESFYRKSFEGFRAEPSPDLLSKIQSNLSAATPPPLKPFWIAKPFLWTVFTATIVSVGITLYVTQEKNAASQRTQETIKAEQLPLNSPSVTSSKEALSPSQRNSGNKAFSSSSPVNPTNDSSSLEAAPVVVDPKVVEAPAPAIEVEQAKQEVQQEEKVDFYKKHSKAKQDTTRPLFVK